MAGEIIGPPKSDAGLRVISLDPATAAVLRAWRARITAERLAAGATWTDSGRVLVDERGTPPHPGSVTKWWRQAVQRSGVRQVRLPDLRHTSAPLALRPGVSPKTGTERLGHSHVTTTLAIYQHITQADDQVVANTLGALLDGSFSHFLAPRRPHGANSIPSDLVWNGRAGEI